MNEMDIKIQKPEYHGIPLQKHKKLGHLNYTVDEINSILASQESGVVLDDAIDSTSSKAVKNSAIAAALDAKQEALVSGTNIKTINGNSILGSGDISIETGTDDVYTKEEVDRKLVEKQDKLDYYKEIGTQVKLSTETHIIYGGNSINVESGSAYIEASDTMLDVSSEGVDIDGNLIVDSWGNITNGTNTLQAELDKKQATLTYDSSPNKDSTNPVTSGGVYTAVNNVSGQVSQLALNKADKATTLSGYGITDGLTDGTYTSGKKYGRTTSGWAEISEGADLTYYSEDTTNVNAKITTSGCIFNVGADSIGCEISGGSGMTIDERYVKLYGEGTLNDKAIATTDQLAYTKINTPTATITENDYKVNTYVAVSDALTITQIDALPVEVVLFVGVDSTGKAYSVTLPTGTMVMGEVDGSKPYCISIFNGYAVVGNFDEVTA